METIRSSADISRIFKEGKRSSNKFLTLIVEKRCSEDSSSNEELEHGHTGRVAFIAGKKNGNACWRNSAKRRLRELVRELGGPWPGFDVLFIAKRPLTEAVYSKVSSTTVKTIEASELGKADEI